MLSFILAIALVALFTSFLIDILFIKGVAQKLQNHKNEKVAKLFECHFCMSFWLAVIISLGVWAFTGEIVYITVPLFSTTLSKLLV